jgi:acetyl-CoA C-acetyltransferase
MSQQREVVILSGVRTAIGDYGGSLKDIPPSDLAARVIKEAVSRAKIDPKEVGQCVVGNVIHTEPRDMYISRLACVNGGLPHDTGALTVNRLCGSGFQAIVSAAQYILLGETDAAVAGGAESMSRGAYASLTQRWGARMGDSKMMDMMVGALTDPFDTVHMGVTAENVAAKCGLTREQQDAFAVESHKRAAAAIAAGHFKSQILPIELKSKKGPVVFDTDEHVRGDASMEGMAKLKAVFAKENGTVTAGNASGINDAAAAVVLMERSAAEKRGLKPLARLIAYGHAGIDPKIMGLGPVSAVQRALARAGLKLDQMDVIESNEAFAAQALGVSKELAMNPQKVNPNGLDPDGEGDVRAAAHRRALRAHHDVHRRRSGHRRRHRADVTPRRRRERASARCAPSRNAAQRSGTANPRCTAGRAIIVSYQRLTFG